MVAANGWVFPLLVPAALGTARLIALSIVHRTLEPLEVIIGSTSFAMFVLFEFWYSATDASSNCGIGTKMY